AGERVRGVRHAGNHADVVGGFVQEDVPGTLLEQIEHGLHGVDLPVADRPEAFRLPADGRPERDAVGTNLAFGLELGEHIEDGVVANLCHARVVQLVDVDDLDTQAPHRRFTRAPDV